MPKKKQTPTEPADGRVDTHEDGRPIFLADGVLITPGTGTVDHDTDVPEHLRAAHGLT